MAKSDLVDTPHGRCVIVELDGDVPLVGGEDGRAVLEMIYAAYESARLGRKVVPGNRRGVRRPIDLWLG